MTKEVFKILTPRDHCRARIGMYMGSSAKEQVSRFVLGKWKDTVYVPALSKMIDEILDNSIDEAIRTNFKFANKIDVSVENNTVTITDNGRGIPQEFVHDTITGEEIPRPLAAWSRVNAGTSFSDERVTIGTNGVGAAATNFLSSSFIGRTWQNENLLEVHYTDGGLNVNFKNKKHAGNGTSVSFTPDFSLFEVNALSDVDTIELIEDRLISLQMAFPEIIFSFNKKKIHISDLKKYSSMFVEEGASVIIEKTDNLAFFFTASSDGFRTNSFINGVNTRQGGTYVEQITNGVVDELVSLVKKKHKIEVAKSVLKNGLTFVMFARNFVNPKFDSQTKERLTNPASNIKEHFENSGVHDVQYIAKKIFAANDIIEPIIAAQLAKKMADEHRDALVAQKKLKKVKVAKHISANNDQATLCLVEGDCIEENTLIETLSGPKKIKDVTTDDLVFTHKHRFKKVQSKSFSLKEGIRINGNIYSRNHRLFVYDTEKNIFEVLEVQYIDIKKHKLIRNRLVYNGFEKTLHVVKSIRKGGILITDEMRMIFSDNHEILFLTKELEIVTKTYKEICVGDIIFL